MKKLLALSVLALTFAAPSAFAHDHDGKGDKGAKMFEKMDTDGNGEISKAEFDAHHAEKFTKMDIDGNGSVTKEEAQTARENWKAEMKEKRESKKEEAPAEVPAE